MYKLYLYVYNNDEKRRYSFLTITNFFYGTVEMPSKHKRIRKVDNKLFYRNRRKCHYCERAIIEQTYK